MQVRDAITGLAGLLASIAPLADPQLPAPSKSFEELAAECAPGIHPSTLKAVVSTESSWNPFAIGVVGGRLERQPRNHPEAVAAARELERQGFNFSLGLGQVNRHNLSKYGETYETVFEPCRNLRAGGAILQECFQRARKVMSDEQTALRAALSCYYSGNFTRGFRADKAGQPSYVQKVVANAASPAPSIPVVPAIQPQDSDSLLTASTRGQPAAKAKQVESRWLIITEDFPQAVEPVAVPIKESAVKVRLSTQGRGATSPSQADAAPAPRDALAAPRIPPNTHQSESPFVQFIN